MLYSKNWFKHEIWRSWKSLPYRVWLGNIKMVGG